MNLIYLFFKIKQFIGSWTWKVHRRGVLGVNWRRGRWRDSTGLHFSGVLCWPCPPLCAGLLPRLLPSENWDDPLQFQGCLVSLLQCGEQDGFLLPKHPAEFWASLRLAISLKGFYNLYFSFPPPTLGHFRILHHGIPGHNISVVLPNDLLQWSAGLKNHTK